MAIQIKSITKIAGPVVNVIVEDTLDQIGTAEDGTTPVYRTYTVRHNINLPSDALKSKIEKEITAAKTAKDQEDALKASLETSVSAIDTVKILATKEVI